MYNKRIKNIDYEGDDEEEKGKVPLTTLVWRVSWTRGGRSMTPPMDGALA